MEQSNNIEVGQILTGTVQNISDFGALVEIGNGRTGLVHISAISHDYVKSVSDHLKSGDTVKVKVLKVLDNGKIALSIKDAIDCETVNSETANQKFQNSNQNSFRNYRKENNVDFHHTTDDRQYARPRQANFRAKNFNAPKSESFEDMLSKFMKSSDDKLSGLSKPESSKRPRFNSKQK